VSLLGVSTIWFYLGMEGDKGLEAGVGPFGAVVGALANGSVPSVLLESTPSLGSGPGRGLVVAESGAAGGEPGCQSFLRQK